MKIYLRIILFVNLLLAIVLVAFPYRLDRTYISIEQVKDFYANKARSPAATLILGDSSAAYGLDPRLIPNSVSLAVPASTSVDLWLELNRYLLSKPAPKCLVMFTSYIDLNFKVGFLEKHAEAGLFDFAQVAAALDSAENEKILFPVGMNLEDSLSKIQLAPHLSYSAWRQYQIGAKHLSFLPNVREFQQLLDEAISAKGYIAARGARKIFDPERHGYLLKKFEPIAFDDYFFAKILEKSAAVGIQIIFVELPLFNPQNLPDISNFEKAHAEHVKRLLKATSGALYFKPSLEFSETDFFDTNHLNIVGSKRFSDATANQLPRACAAGPVQ